jgi:hypothetical protein
LTTIAFHMAPEYGITFATTSLARALQDRDHRVVYLTSDRVGAQLAAHGFDVQALPNSSEALAQADPSSPMAPGVARVATAYLTQMRSMGLRLPFGCHDRLERLAYRSTTKAARLCAYNNLIARWIARAHPDVALVDILRPWNCLPFLEAGVKVISVNPSFAAPLNTSGPHVFSEMLPRSDGQASILQRARHVWEWRRIAGTVALDVWMLSVALPLGGLRLMGRMRRAGARFAVHEFGLRLAGQEIVIMPRALDFPSTRQADGRVYAGLSVDMTRSDNEFSWSFLRPGVPLVYCAFGMMRQDPIRPIVTAIVEAYRHSQQYDVLIAAPRSVWPDTAALPNWITLRERVPQIDALTRAGIFVTHAGGASIREAIAVGVPMVAVPIGGCEIGHAARLEYHGLGCRVRLASLSPVSLRNAVERVSSHGHFRANINVIRASADAEATAVVQVIEDAVCE